MIQNIAAGNRPLSLAAAFRRVSSLIRSDKVDYDWDMQSRCNCGLVAQAALGVSRSQLTKLLKPSDGETWADFAHEHCPVTGIPTLKIFRALHDAGLRFEDYQALEDLSSPEIIARVQADGTHVTLIERRFIFFRVSKSVQKEIQYDDEMSLAVYLEAWASLIEEFHAANQQPTEVAMEQAELRPLVTK